MQNRAWEYLYVYFSEQKKIYTRFSSEELNALLSSLLNSPDDNESLQDIASEALLLEVATCFSAIHKSLCENLLLCRDNLNAFVKKQELDYLMAALIFQCDESVLTQELNQLLSRIACDCESKLHSPTFAIKSNWPTVQGALLQCRDGGERFFDHAEALLNSPSDFALAIEVYYFCLKHGFLGEYINKQGNVDKLLDKLAQAISDNRSAYIAPTSSDSMLKNDREPTIGEEHVLSP